MSSLTRSVIIPSEVQTREFDAKLLLGCLLAEAGAEVFVGARHELHANIHKLPRSLYVSKDFRRPSLRIFRIMKQLGHEIVAWDEEALLVLTPQIYYQRRVTPEAISLVREFYSWGTVDKELIENAPGYPGAPVHVTGNPRVDLLRPELRPFHDEDVARLRARYGNFILINSNFGAVNPKIKMMLLQPGVSDPRTGDVPTPEYDEVLRYRGAMFPIFLELAGKLARRFPDRTIVVRPHPAEDHSVWLDAVADTPNVKIVHEGSVLPWRLAADVMVHNSCTTGLESFLLGRPPILYQPNDIPAPKAGLSNKLSKPVHSESDLFEMIEAVLDEKIALTQSDEQRAAIDEVLAGRTGPLASERIAQHILAYFESINGQSAPPLLPRLMGETASRVRKLEKAINLMQKAHKGSEANNRHRYAGVPPSEVSRKIGALSSALGRFEGISGEQVKGQIYRIAPT